MNLIIDVESLFKLRKLTISLYNNLSKDLRLIVNITEISAYAELLTPNDRKLITIPILHLDHRDIHVKKWTWENINYVTSWITQIYNTAYYKANEMEINIIGDWSL